MKCKECGQVITDLNELCPARQTGSNYALSDGLSLPDQLDKIMSDKTSVSEVALNDGVMCCDATAPKELRRQIMSSMEPKNEREHWAARRIEELERSLNNLLNDCINFDGGKLTDCIMEEASKVLKNT